MGIQRYWALVLAVVVSIPVASAAESGVRACYAEKDDARRLACYDTEVGKMVTARIAAHVAGITRESSARVVVRLDNEEVWEQVEDGPDLGLAVGDSVRIEKGMLGSYWMSGHSSVAIKVRRVERNSQEKCLPPLCPDR